MAQENGPVIDVTLKSGADLSGSQYLFVKLDANGNVIVCTAAGEDAFGVLQNKPLAGAGQTCVVRVHGTSKVVASAALNPNIRIATDATGKAKQAAALVQATGAGSYSMGKLLRAASGAGSIVSAFIQSSGVLPTAAA